MVTKRCLSANIPNRGGVQVLEQDLANRAMLVPSFQL